MKSDAYWRSVVRLGFLFVIVFAIIEHIGNYGFKLEPFKTNILEKGLLFTYLRAKILGGLVYGLIISFVFQRRKIIESRK